MKKMNVIRVYQFWVSYRDSVMDSDGPRKILAIAAYSGDPVVSLPGSRPPSWLRLRWPNRSFIVTLDFQRLGWFITQTCPDDEVLTEVDRQHLTPPSSDHQVPEAQ